MQQGIQPCNIFGKKSEILLADFIHFQFFEQWLSAKNFPYLQEEIGDESWVNY